jgi:uncharacterized protein YjiS (DUF1127 family)
VHKRSLLGAFAYQTDISSIRSQVVDVLLTHVAAPFVAVWHVVLEWGQRRQSRQVLRSLRPNEIRDFCLDLAQAEREARKPFWRA